MRAKGWLGMGLLGIFLGGLFGAEVAGPAAPGESIEEVFERAQAQARQGNFGQAQQSYRQALLLAFQKATLTPEEQYVVGVCHLYLAAMSFDQVLQTGQLDPDRSQIAQAWRDLIWPRSGPASEAPSSQRGPAAPASTPATDPLTTVGYGQEIDLDSYLAPGKTTVLLFVSNVALCQRWEGYLRQLVGRRPDLVGVRVLIDREGQPVPDFESPLARQFKITQVPFLQIFGPDKKLQKEGLPAEEQVLQWIREAVP